jgi:hypothetical protein
MNLALAAETASIGIVHARSPSRLVVRPERTGPIWLDRVARSFEK